MSIPVTSNLVQLLHPSSLSAFANGDLVNAWADTSGAGNNVASSGTNRPEKVTNGVRFVNQDFLNGTLANVGASGITIFMAVSNASASGVPGGFICIHDGTVSSDLSTKCHLIYESGSSYIPYAGNAVSGGVSIANISTTTRIFLDRFASGSSALGLFPFFQTSSSGTAIVSGSAGVVYGARQFSSTSPTPVFFTKYDLHLAAIYDRALTNSEVTDVCNWIQSELGLISSGAAAKPQHPMSQQVIG